MRSKVEMQSKILAFKPTMEYLALKWAKISERAFKARFEGLEEATAEELKHRLDSLRQLHDETFSSLMDVWKRLPESQWETTFIQQMRHLPEYTDLRKALNAFKNQFMGKTNAKATADKN